MGAGIAQGRRIAAMDVYTQLEDKLVDMTRRLTQEAKCVPQPACAASQQQGDRGRGRLVVGARRAC